MSPFSYFIYSMGGSLEDFCNTLSWRTINQFLSEQDLKGIHGQHAEYHKSAKFPFFRSGDGAATFPSANSGLSRTQGSWGFSLKGHAVVQTSMISRQEAPGAHWMISHHASFRCSFDPVAGLWVAGKNNQTWRHIRCRCRLVITSSWWSRSTLAGGQCNVWAWATVWFDMFVWSHGYPSWGTATVHTSAGVDNSQCRRPVTTGPFLSVLCCRAQWWVLFHYRSIYFPCPSQNSPSIYLPNAYP